jgi:hypothetical protein
MSGGVNAVFSTIRHVRRKRLTAYRRLQIRARLKDGGLWRFYLHYICPGVMSYSQQTIKPLVPDLATLGSF